MVLGKSEEALTCFLRVIELNPRHDEIYGMIGVLLEELGRSDEAMKYYNLGIQQNSATFKSNYYKGHLLAKRGQYEEAIKQYSRLIKESHPGIFYHMGNAFAALGNQEKAKENYLKGSQKEPEECIQYCNRGQCFMKLGKTKEAMDDFKKCQELVDTDKQIDLAPLVLKYMKDCLKLVLETEETAKNTENMLQKMDMSNPALANFKQNVENFQEQKEKVAAKALDQIDKKHASETQNNLSELNKIREEFNKQIEAMKKELGSLKSDVKALDQKVTNLESQFKQMKEEIKTKLTDFDAKLKMELNKQELSSSDQEKIFGYFKTFIGTFSSLHVTADGGQVQLDTGNTTATILSFVVSFSPFFGSTLLEGIKSVGDFLQSKEMKSNARKIKLLSPDAPRLSQLIGSAGYRILTDKNKQKLVIEATEQSLKKKNENLFQKLSQFCEKVQEKIDVYLYTELFKTTAERIGHNDANEIIEEWIKGKITVFQQKINF